jgi:cytidyltransferase-like protein
MKVLTFGVYDMLHIGHILLFKHAKELGSKLIVAVQDGDCILKYKPGTKMIYNTDERLYMVNSIRYVDEVVTYKDVDIDIQKIDLDKRMLVAQTAIKMEANIVERLKKLEAEIDKTKTLSPDDLQIAIENAAKEAELDYSISNVTTTPVGEFKVNKIILTTTPQELYVVAKFESLLAKLEPYVAVAESTLTGDKQGKASVRYIISSFN